jgi:arginine-tRNA-protein transferase
VTSITNLRVYTTHPHPCSYLDNELATTLFIDPQASINKAIYSSLSESGFRRSGEHLYTPHCHDCQACIPVRIPVHAFRRSRSQQKIWNRNQALQIANPADIAARQFYELYDKYICARHSDGDMYPPDEKQYRTFLTKEWGVTEYYSFSDKNDLKALAVVDILNDALSAVYTFYDPYDERKSLGSYCILWQVELARTLGLSYVYLGYWIKNCNKMNYKTRFKPLEYFIEGSWRRSV